MTWFSGWGSTAVISLAFQFVIKVTFKPPLDIVTGSQPLSWSLSSLIALLPNARKSDHSVWSALCFILGHTVMF